MLFRSNPAASLADGRRTSQNATLAHDNSLEYLQQLRDASPSAHFVFLSGFPLLVNTTAGVANPVAAILSFEMALRWSLGRPDLADKLYAAVESALNRGARTRDIGGSLTTAQMGEAVLAEL